MRIFRHNSNIHWRHWPFRLPINSVEAMKVTQAPSPAREKIIHWPHPFLIHHPTQSCPRVSVNLKLRLDWVGLGRNFPPFGGLGQVVGLIWQIAKNKVFTQCYISFKLLLYFVRTLFSAKCCRDCAWNVVVSSIWLWVELGRGSIFFLFVMACVGLDQTAGESDWVG